MDDEITTIETKNRQTKKIVSFFLKNKKKIISILVALLFNVNNR